MLHTKSTRPGTCRMFETPLIERFSRVNPVAPFVFWVPFVAYFLYRGHQSGLSIPAIAGLALFGTLAWTITEYLLHRYVFHREGSSYNTRRFFFVLHGVHHDFPMDTTRLVMPLGVSIPMGVIAYLLFRPIFGAQLVDPVFAGFGMGYLAYDGIHYGTHHFRMKGPVLSYLKRYHMVHHFTGEESRWGVSSPLWDYVFGTSGKKRTSTESVVNSSS